MSIPATVWSVLEAKAKLSEVLRRARGGERQIIGAQEPCVVLSMADFEALQRKAGAVHLGRWLVENTPCGAEFEPPSRSAGRPNAFEIE
ncbi:type II toxin-antitoxin system Phd/YefM family antitoxin [Labrys sp. KNU-23]|uniref:type II toxin-antitoxin system prevent-host-death family antitoxin n=1 Tax=Labrys sp. KNU-23 TaxID=2789216 RepID=UPI0011EE3516|nr:type II toxin-antitoxin system prevent-host-death family antitoxin [Labrys sp. KNU-23]QEN88286.1 type II toxin-antitoxin system Phd/YefM family antitoxin [Labrys sp. KNU-23]